MSFKQLAKHFLIKHTSKPSSQNASKFWEKRDKDFDDDYWVNLYNSDKSEHRKKIYDVISSSKYDSIFEFGCNSGPNFENISKLKHLKKYDGIDINNTAIEFAKKKYMMKNVNFHCLNYTGSNSLPFITDHKIFLTVYSMAYLDFNSCISLLNNFNDAKLFILAEPSQKIVNSLFLNRIPEFSHNYENIFKNHLNGKFIHFHHKLDKCKNELRDLSIYYKLNIK